MPTVREIANKTFPSVAPSASIAGAAQVMNDNDAEVIAVCQNKKLHGMVTQSAIISAVVSKSPDLRKLSVIRVMQNDLPRVSPGVDILDAARMMADHGVLYMPVVQNGKLHGILTIDELLHESPALAIMVLSKFYAKADHSPKSRDASPSEMRFAST